MKDIRFAVSRSDAKRIELRPGGKKESLTWENRKEYLRLVSQYRRKEFAQQTDAIRQGLGDIVPGHLLSFFSWSYLESRVCGRGMTLEQVDLLERMTKYSSHQNTDQHVKLFWKMMRFRFTDEQRSRFLVFVWGRSRLPEKESDFEQKFEIQAHNKANRSGNPDQWFPIAHTCSFALELPKYTNLDSMTKKILWAINNCSSIDGDGTMRQGPRVLIDDDEDEELESLFE